MKKLFLLATAAFLFTGFAFSNQGGDGKKCAKGKECHKEGKNKKDCKDMKKDAKATKTTAKEATKVVAKA